MLCRSSKISTCHSHSERQEDRHPLDWKRRRVRVESIHKCETQLFMHDSFPKVRIMKAYREPLKAMKLTDYRKEGGYTKETFIDVWTQINGSYDGNRILVSVEFEKLDEA